MDEPAKPEISEEEFDAALSLPAPFVNKTYLMMTPITARLVFAEIRNQTSKPHMRAAVCMSITDLVALRDIIDRTIEGKTQAIEIQKKADSNG